MESRSFKKLAPAPAEPGTGENQAQISVPVPGPRRNLTRNACSPCKIKKAKCDGNRPTCSRCQKNGDTCVYEVNKRDIGKLQLLSDHDTARLQSFELVFGVLQNGPDHEAADLYSQIRLGRSVEMLASTLNPSSIQSSTSASSKNPAAASSSYSTAMRDDSETPAPEASQGFLDLLYDRDDWLQTPDGTTPDGTSAHNTEGE
ncbi:uncharacterized protein F4822DRAFT_96786 [Hypoxylon trugodes]|uniref:uncharacterized protein n=1 Tax=Hypoxylon trugodes TaxID=326681 RepID=UPI002190182C|nr:uncharacterized protein F4822DRAFT_96786 [Hypoxylon trugodes]KAI1382786.1 hypothetical protein F4822DRAFT_96786 [Hypoxylon trugodes]